MAAAVVVAGLAVAAVVLPWLVGTLRIPGPQVATFSGRIGDALPYFGLGLLTHLVVALPAVGIAALWSPPAVRRIGTTLGGTVVCLILAVPLDDLAAAGSPLARLLPHAVPPFEVARQMVDGRTPALILHTLGPTILGALVFTGAATAVHVALARRRS